MYIARRDFHAWLSSHAADAIIGHTVESTRCPVATYIKSVDPSHDVAVCSGDHVMAPTGTRWSNTDLTKHPVWLQEFIRAIDGGVEIPSCSPVLASRALAILDAIPHHFDDTGDAYDATQTQDHIRNHSTLVVEPEKVVGFLYDAWPTAVTVYCGAFHKLIPGNPWPEGAKAAVAKAQELGYELDEAFR